MWPGWQAVDGGVGAAGGEGAAGFGDSAQRLLLGRTLAALGGCWPPGTCSLTAEDVSGVEQATGCFLRLLEVSRVSEGIVAGVGASNRRHCVRSGGSVCSRFSLYDLLLPSPQASTSPGQLRLLAKLLSVTWQEGAVWGAPPESGQGEGGNCWPASALHLCWGALGAALLRAGQPLDAIRLVDRTSHLSRAGRPAPLSVADVDALMEQASVSAPGQSTLLLPCLGLLSPSRRHQKQAVQALKVCHAWCGCGRSHKCGFISSATYFSVSLPQVLLPSPHADSNAETVSVSRCLVAAAIQAGVCNALCSSSVAWEATSLALAELPPHPAVAGGDATAELTGCLLPTIASELVLEGLAGWGATLAAARLRLHPALAAMGGSATLLEKFLRDSLQCGWKLQPHHDVIMEDPSSGPATGFAAPYALVAAAGRMSGDAEAALRCLGADLRV